MSKYNKDKDIYLTIRNDYIKHRDNHVHNNECSLSISEWEDWITNYVKAMTNQEKNKVYQQYGIKRLLINVVDIAKAYGYKSYDEFVDDNYHKIDDIGNFFENMMILEYIICHDVIPELFYKIKPN